MLLFCVFGCQSVPCFTLVAWLRDADHGGDERCDADGFQRGGGEVAVQLVEVVDGEQQDEHIGHDPQHVEDVVAQRTRDERARGRVMLLGGREKGEGEPGGGKRKGK